MAVLCARRDRAARRRPVARGLARVRALRRRDRRRCSCCARPLARGLARWMPRALALALSVPLAAQLACGPLLVLISPDGARCTACSRTCWPAPAAPVATIVGLAACLAAPIPWAAVRAHRARLAARQPGSPATAHDGQRHSRAIWCRGSRAGRALPLSPPSAGDRGGHRRAAPAPGRRHRDAARVRAAAVLLLAVVAGVLAGGRRARLGRGPVDPSARTGASLACDVGQGDAVLLRSAGAIALVDTGPEPEPLDACLSRAGVDRIDLLVLTHFDLDHVGGVDAVVGRVGTVLHGPPGTPRAIGSLTRLHGGGARTLEAHAGMTGTLGAATWRVLWPRATRARSAGQRRAASCSTSAAAASRHPAARRPLGVAAAALAASGDSKPPYDLVKIAHHGSADQDAACTRLARPAVALVTVGVDNDYGHPRTEILDILRAIGARIARTDRQGSSRLAHGGEGVSVWRERGERGRDPLGRLGAWRRARDAPPRARPAPRSRRCRGARRSPPRSCSSPVPEEVCAERAIAGIRDYLRAEDPSLEVSDVRADDYAPGSLLALTSPSLFGEPRLVRVSGVEKCSDAFLSEAVSYLGDPQEGATVILRHTGATVRGKKLLDAVRAGEGGGHRDRVPGDQARLRSLRLRGGRVLDGRQADRPRRAARARLGLRRRPHRARRRLPAAHRRRAGRRHRAGRRALLRRARRDLGVRRRRHRDRRAATARRSSPCGTRSPRAPIPFRSSRRSPRSCARWRASPATANRPPRWPAGSASRTGRSTARGATCRAGPRRRSGMAIQATARADAEVKGGSRDRVFALERLVTVIATRAPFGS